MSPLPKDLVRCLKLRREAVLARALARRASAALAVSAHKRAEDYERAATLLIRGSWLLQTDPAILKARADALLGRVADLRTQDPARAARLLCGLQHLLRVYHHLVMAQPL